MSGQIETKLLNSGVRWREMVPILITMFSLTVGICMGAIFLHAQAPHDGAVGLREFDQRNGSVDKYFKMVQDSLERLDKKIDRLAELNHQHNQR